MDTQTRYLTVLLMAVLAASRSIQPAAAINQRHSLYDPIDSFDDIDAHTVTAGNGAAAPANQLDKFQTLKDSFVQRRGEPNVQTSTTTTAGDSSPPSGERQKLSQTSRSPFLSIGSSLGPATSRSPSANLRDASSRQSTTRRQVVSSIAATVLDDQPQRKHATRRSSVGEEPRHWSALENYYKTLRRPVAGGADDGQYKILQQILQAPVEPSVEFDYAKQWIAPGSGRPAALSPYDAPTGTKSAALFPLNEPARQGASKTTADRLPPVYMGAPKEPYYSTVGGGGGGGGPYTLGLEEGRANLTSLLQMYDHLSKILRDHPQVKEQQQVASGPFFLPQQQIQVDVPDRLPVFSNHSLPPSFLFNSTPVQQQLVAISPTPPRPAAPVAQFDNLADWFAINQQRAKHQQETFDSWYDYQRTLQLGREDSYCEPRVNQVQLQRPQRTSELAALLARADGVKSSPGAIDLRPDFSEGTRGLTPASFPSHLGVYSGLPASDEKFLCGATLIHERFALTLASCVVSQPNSLNQTRLFIRSNEWNAADARKRLLADQNRNRNASEQLDSLVTQTRAVQKAHVFPKYLNGSSEHNLAILELAEPVKSFGLPAVAPACQMPTRQMVRARSCWAPVRNVSSTEYFDAEGEGETKLRRETTMREAPVRLFAQDELRCRELGGQDLFNFNHPNFICAGDYRRPLASGRLALNTTDQFGSGIYCVEGDGVLSLVSMLHPISANSPTAQGYLDLSYYRPWMRNVVMGFSY